MTAPCPAHSPRPQRILIVKLSSIGDIVHALPVATALRREFPALQITWAVEVHHAALLRDHAAIDRVVTFPPFAWGALSPEWVLVARRGLRALQAERYDVALDLQGLLKSSAIALASRAPLRIGIPRQREGAALVSHAVPLPAGVVHAVDRYLACAAFLGARTDPVDFGLAVDPAARASAKRMLERNGIDANAPLIILNPSASQAWKGWPDQRWAAVADGLAGHGAVILIGAAAHKVRHRAIRDRTRGAVADLTGETTLAQVVALLGECALHVAPDTGTLHIAAALGRPVVGVFGPTSPSELGPYRQLANATYHAGACGLGCPRWCLLGRRCLQAVTPDDVLTRARQALTSGPLGREL